MVYLPTGGSNASTLAIAIPVLSLIGIGVAEAADPTLLAETGGFLLGNAQRCGVPVERVERAGKVIHGFIEIAANDPSEAAAADRRFTEMFLASALPEPDPQAFPSCAVVIRQFERLERHHEQAGEKRAEDLPWTRSADRGAAAGFAAGSNPH